MCRLFRTFARFLLYKHRHHLNGKKGCYHRNGHLVEHRDEHDGGGDIASRRAKRHHPGPRAADLRLPVRTDGRGEDPRAEGAARPPSAPRLLGGSGVCIHGKPGGFPHGTDRRCLSAGKRGGLHLRQRLVGKARHRGCQNHGGEARLGTAWAELRLPVHELHRQHEPEHGLPPERRELHGQRSLCQRQPLHRTGLYAHPAGTAGDGAVRRCTGDELLQHGFFRCHRRFLQTHGRTDESQSPL